MSDTNRPDTRIAGAGTVTGGTYGEVMIAGSGTVEGDVDCTTFKVGGVADVHGTMTAQNISVSGSANFSGDVKGGEVVFSGNADVHGKLDATTLKISGVARIDGAVSAERVEIKGTTKIAGDCQAESFDAQGVFSVAGLLNAGTVTIKLYGGCDAHDIGGETIDVRLAQPWVFLPFLGERNLTADSIEGDTIYLESTRAKVVRGASVTIGSDCAIDLVEYSGTLTGSAGVVASRKVEPKS
jgi:cytoskeletal protein CcmA (bactofilin family)